MSKILLIVLFIALCSLHAWPQAVSHVRVKGRIIDKETQQRVWILRKHLSDMNPVEAMEFMKDRIKNTQTNEEFLISMNG